MSVEKEVVEQQLEHNDDDEPQPTNIDSIPLALIGECASYLRVDDYVNFGQSNMTIHTACYSPSRLHTFIGFHRDWRDRCNLKLFKTLVSLEIIELNVFIHYFKSHSVPPRMHKLRNLTLHEFNPAHWSTFCGLCIPFDQITSLRLCGYKKQRFDFGALIDFLLHFKNVTHLTLNDIELNGFDAADERLPQLFPKLISVCSECYRALVARSLKDHLLRRHSKQIMCIKSEYNSDYHEIKNWKYVRYPMLKELMVTINQCDHTGDAASMKMVINNVSKLEKLCLIWQKVPKPNILDRLREKYAPRTYSKDIYDSTDYAESMNQLLTFVFASTNNLKHICFVGVSMQTYIIDLILSILVESRNQIKDELTIEFKEFLFNADTDEELKALPIPRLVRALDNSGIHNFRLILNVRVFSENIENDHVVRLYEYFQNTHLISLLLVGDKGAAILIISNKNCTINGYSQIQCQSNK